MVKIAIDAGHSKVTAGHRSPNGVREWSYNNKIVAAIIKKLQQYDVDILRVDEEKKDLSIVDRNEKANKTDLYVSIHHNNLRGNWHNGGGVNTKHNEEAEQLAAVIQKAAVEASGLRDQGTSSTHAQNELTVPAVIIHGGYMDSRIDAEVLEDDKKMDEIGEAVAAAIVDHLDLKKKTKKK